MLMLVFVSLYRSTQENRWAWTVEYGLRTDWHLTVYEDTGRRATHQIARQF